MSAATETAEARTQKLEGRWKGTRATGVPETAQVSANSFATNSEIIAQGNQITFNTPGGRQPPANFTVDKEDATTVVVRTDRDGKPETFTFNDKADEMENITNGTKMEAARKLQRMVEGED